MSAKSQLIFAILSNIFNNHDDIHKFYRNLCNINDDIYTQIPKENEILSRYEIERRCVYEESRLGDGECDEMVINDCIDVLNEIITFLQTSENDDSDSD